jgi:mono/diheme cytochrome c family protein
MRRDASVWVLGLAAASLLTSCEKPKPALYDTSLPVLEVMVHQIDPGAWAFWGASGEVTDAAGSKSLRPTTEEGWLAAENGAVQVAEGGNLMLLPGRVRDEEWIRLSKKLTQDGLAAKAAVEAKDSAKMYAVGAEMFQTCIACHTKYVPALQPGAEPVGAPLPDWPADVKLKQEQFLEGKK